MKLIFEPRAGANAFTVLSGSDLLGTINMGGTPTFRPKGTVEIDELHQIVQEMERLQGVRRFRRGDERLRWDGSSMWQFNTGTSEWDKSSRHIAHLKSDGFTEQPAEP